VSFFAADGAQLVPGSEVRGLEAIAELMGPAFADTSFTLSWEPTRAGVAASGDLGYTIGRYRSRRLERGGLVVERTGAYVTMWRRDDAGTWKVVLDSGVPDPEP
jgi:ketosteroid isomerase-like protein